MTTARRDHVARPVIVRTYGAEKPSKHLVDLSNSEREELWADAPFYAESVPLAPTVQTVDFGELICRAKECSVFAPAPIYEGAASSVTMIFQRVFDKATMWRAEFVQWKEGRQRTSRSKRVAPVFQFSLARSLAVVAMLIAIVPFPAIAYYQSLKQTTADAVADGTDGFLALQSSTKAAFDANVPGAEAELEKALGSFSLARSRIENNHGFLLSIVKMLPYVGPYVQSRQNLLIAGQQLAIGNAAILQGIQEARDAANATLTDRLAIMRIHLKSAAPAYEAAKIALDSVDEAAIPTAYEQSFHKFRAVFGGLAEDLGDMIRLLDATRLAIGGDSFKRYLVVFQNNRELRPTGGFMGSYAIVDVQKGKIARIQIPPGGTYDLQGQLSEWVKPPAPLLLSNPRWEFQDANWFPDFAASARKIEWFYQRGRGNTVDGVIAVNATVLERLLRVLGPVRNDAYQVVMTSDNAVSSLQQIIEQGADKKINQPKAVIADVGKQLLNLFGTLSPKQSVHMATELLAAARGKEIQAYFNDATINDAFRGTGMSGEIRETEPGQDYLAVFASNLQGQKSDAEITQTIGHQAVVSLDGSVFDTVVVRRAHHGTTGQDFSGVPNIAYLRVYVPLGSTLLDAGGFTYPKESAFHAPDPWERNDTDLARVERDERFDPKTGTRVTTEFGKTVFGNWVAVNPGDTSEVYFTYRLPGVKALDARANTPSSYTLVAQKQSGIVSNFSTRIIYPDGWAPAYKSDDAVSLAMNGGTWSGPLESDRVIGLVMAKR